MTRVRLDLGGAELEFEGVLRVMHRAYDVLLDVQAQVLGPASPKLNWVLVGLESGSAVAELEARPRDDVRPEQAERVAAAYVRGIGQWEQDPSARPPYFTYLAIQGLHDLAAELRRYGTQSLTAVHVDAPDRPRGVVQPADLEGPIAPPVEPVRGSVVGRIEAINLHGKREATLWDELEDARVVLTFKEPLVERVRLALRHRVEVSGEVTEDEDGRPTRIRLEELEVLPGDEKLRPLAELVGLFPDLTDGQDSTEWLRQQRRERGHA